MSKSQSRIPLAVINLIGFLVVVAVNALATTIPLGGKTTGQLSDQYPNLFVPSGLTFSIWGVIYILLGIYVVYGLIHVIRKSQQTNDFTDQIGILFIITCVANAGWIFSWQYEVLPLSLVCMVILLLTLILIYNRLKVGWSTAALSEKYLVHLPMSIYLGWITIATIANVTALLVAYKWNRFGISDLSIMNAI
jgi:translocator protein